ncbi:MAG: hypothetical protein ACJA13_003633 [Paraglaciecola sp.]|jgi:hypothetical protein
MLGFKQAINNEARQISLLLKKSKKLLMTGEQAGKAMTLFLENTFEKLQLAVNK